MHKDTFAASVIYLTLTEIVSITGVNQVTNSTKIVEASQKLIITLASTAAKYCICTNTHFCAGLNTFM